MMANIEPSNIPEPSRPHPLPGYGIPTDTEGLLTWDFVAKEMQQARNYWVATLHPDGRPHAIPIWGVWLNDTLHFGGGPQTRWSRNLMNNPNVSVHLESGNKVIILEGVVTAITEADDPRLETIDDAYEVKYGIRHGPTIWVLRPDKVLAWTEFPQTATRWVFNK